MDGMGWDGMRGTALAAAGLPDLCCSSRRAYLLRAGLGWAGDVDRLRACALRAGRHWIFLFA